MLMLELPTLTSARQPAAHGESEQPSPSGLTCFSLANLFALLHVRHKIHIFTRQRAVIGGRGWKWADGVHKTASNLANPHRWLGEMTSARSASLSALFFTRLAPFFHVPALT